MHVGGKLPDPYLQAPRAALLLARQALLNSQFTAEAVTLVAGSTTDGESKLSRISSGAQERFMRLPQAGTRTSTRSTLQTC